MSLVHKIIADIDATAEEAPELAEKIRTWLLDKKIIRPDVSDDSLYPGHPLGEHGNTIYHVDCRPADWNARNWSGPFIGGTVNIRAERQVCYTGENAWYLACPVCHHTFDAYEAWKDAEGGWYAMETINIWFERQGNPLLSCPKCEHAQLLTEWDGPSPWAFCELAIWIEGRLDLSDDFVRCVSEVLGHRVRIVHCHV